MKSLKDVLMENNVPFDENGKIALPPWVKRIYLDIGLSFDAPHTQNWIDNDVNNDMMVFGFEANPFWVQYITSEIKDNNFKDFHTNTKPLQYEHINKKCFIVPVALHDVNKPCFMDFHVPSYSEGCGSLLPHTPVLGDTAKRFSVPVYSLKDFFDLLPFDKIECVDYIKVDVQGCDIDVLKSAGLYLKEYVAYVTAEPETYQYYGAEGNTADNIKRLMEDNGFQYVRHPNTKDPTFLNTKFQHKRNIYIWQNY